MTQQRDATGRLRSQKKINLFFYLITQATGRLKKKITQATGRLRSLLNFAVAFLLHAVN
jgi:hypothetical protein